MPTIVMTHGAFCGGWAFEDFRRPFEALGWNVLTPDLPGHGAGDNVAGRSMSDYAQSLVKVCEDLADRPVLLGHSMGGLVCQLAARRIQPRALVLLAPSPPWGVHGSSFEEAVTAFGVGVVDPLWTGAPLQPDRGLMRTHSLDRVPRERRDAILARLCPESGRAIREVLNWWLDPFMTTSIGPGTLPGPALAIVGARDVVHPAATVRQTAARVGADLRVVPEMSHWLIGEKGWEDVADSIVTWLAREASAAA